MARDNRIPILALTTVVTAAVLLAGLFVLKRMVGGANNVVVSAAEKEPVRPATYASWRAAMADLEPGAAHALASTDEERALVGAFEAVMTGDTSAGRRLEALRGANDAGVRRMAIELLGQHLFAEGKWRAFVALAASEPALLTGGSLTPGDLVFARALAGAPAERLVLAGGTRVPTDRVLSGSPVVVVRVNGRIRHFVLDTGSSTTVLSSAVARACNVEPLGTETGKGVTATSATVTFRPAVIARLELGKFIIENHPAAIVDPEALTLRIAGVPVMKLDGIIGWPVFRYVAMRIDPERGWTTITRASFRERRPRNLFWLGYPAVSLRTEDGRRLNFGLDTGAARSGIRPSFFDKIPAGRIERTGGVAVGAGGPVPRERIRNVVLHLDDLVMRFDGLATTEGMEGAALWRPDGKLGYDVGGHGTVVVDWPSGRFDVEP